MQWEGGLLEEFERVGENGEYQQKIAVGECC